MANWSWEAALDCVFSDCLFASGLVFLPLVCMERNVFGWHNL